MKKISLFLISFLFISCSAQAGLKDDLKAGSFIVETDEDSATDSLNRIAGDIDLGFTSEDQEYKSPDHYQPGPFALQNSEEKAKQSY